MPTLPKIVLDELVAGREAFIAAYGEQEYEDALAGKYPPHVVRIMLSADEHKEEILEEISSRYTGRS